jgi:hypothetical protein
MSIGGYMDRLPKPSNRRLLQFMLEAVGGVGTTRGVGGPQIARHRRRRVEKRFQSLCKGQREPAIPNDELANLPREVAMDDLHIAFEFIPFVIATDKHHGAVLDKEIPVATLHGIAVANAEELGASSRLSASEMEERK